MALLGVHASGPRPLSEPETRIACFPRTSAFVVELPAGRLASTSVGRFAQAVDEVARAG